MPSELPSSSPAPPPSPPSTSTSPQSAPRILEFESDIEHEDRLSGDSFHTLDDELKNSNEKECHQKYARSASTSNKSRQAQPPSPSVRPTRPRSPVFRNAHDPDIIADEVEGILDCFRQLYNAAYGWRRGTGKKVASKCKSSTRLQLGTEPAQSWQKRRVHWAAWYILERKLAETKEADRRFWRFIQDKVRFDFYTTTDFGFFVFRMPTPLHERLIALFESIVTEHLNIYTADSAGSGAAAAEFAKQIGSQRSPRLQFNQEDTSSQEVTPGRPPTQHEPDACWGMEGSPYPGVIFEAMYTQKTADAPRLADDYLLGTGGADIHLVLGIDIQDNGTASLHEFRREFSQVSGGDYEVGVVSKTRLLRNGPASPCQGELRLQLKDFSNLAFTPDLDDRIEEIVINFSKLNSAITAAEAHATGIKTTLAARQSGSNSRFTKTLFPANLKKRRYRSPSAEQLTPEDEARFQELEQRDEERGSSTKRQRRGQQQPDADWHPPAGASPADLPQRRSQRLQRPD